MSPARPRRRRRLLAGAAVALGLAVVAVVAVRLQVWRDRARAVPVEVTRERYRATTMPTTAATATAATAATATAATATAATAAATGTDGSPVAPPPALVEPGVFRYRTSGQESVDVLGGATHHYPAETTITVTLDGCGVRLRWDALVERRDEWRLCSMPAGIEVQPVGLQYHEFFGTPDAEAVVCDQPVLVVSLHATPATTRPSCMLGDDPWSPVWQVLEPATRTVDGATIPVRHVQLAVDDNDDYWEHTVVDWYVAADGLPVEVTVQKESRSPSPIGGVVYRENCRLELVSRVPLT